ncbi:MAG: SDR family NAD(P)-dependent oxidoreductase, partial [Gemmatimonadetes bacterium]|nr:SDR family NAD(P)-dependent oxidoreductase [Gemmatimonadota bacterium]
MTADLQGKTAIVTGSSKGIGRAIAQTLAGAGANVVISARDVHEVRTAAEELAREGGGQVIGVPCDVRHPDQVQELIERAVVEFGGLD